MSKWRSRWFYQIAERQSLLISLQRNNSNKELSNFKIEQGKVQEWFFDDKKMHDMCMQAPGLHPSFVSVNQ